MCYDDNARPPHPPGEAGKARGEDLVLKAADGNQFAAYAAYPEQGTGAEVVILPDVRGLHQFYKELALRLAEQGIQAIAIDYFGRTAGLTARDESFDFWPHVRQLQIPGLFADISAAINQVRQSSPQAPIFTMGFCLGGSISLMSATQKDFGLAGAIGFYAGLSRQLAGSEGSVLAESRKIVVPVLGLFGEADQGIPLEDVRQLDQQLAQNGIEHQIITYPGAPHSFFDRRATEFAQASEDAWKRVLEFITAHTPEKTIV